MTERPRLKRAPSRAGLKLVRINRDLDRYRAVFRRVGEPWLWFSRLVISDRALSALLDDARIEAYALSDGTADIGIVELDFRQEATCELTYFGLVPEAIGTGAGRHLMNAAIRKAFRRPIGRLFLHTCSLDHPGALEFYLRSGFTPYRRALEVADDPRLKGFLPPGSAPHVPMLPVARAKKARRAAARHRKADG
jgi:GNAT superfamily N-acetyltransferase